mmetsp:Transcript_63498/g.112945  ORF Transcript_63498/g.112945 Transcript_63498/m.112945 type:complete len:456 (-) Transcript_63498:255-1622(-)
MALTARSFSRLALLCFKLCHCQELTLYGDTECTAVSSADFQSWDVDDAGCATVTSESGTRYIQFACVDKGILQIAYPEAGCKGPVQEKLAKPWKWWLAMADGECIFDHLEEAYLKFSAPPPASLRSRVGDCDVHFATEKFEYRDAECTDMIGEVQELNYASSGCLDVTGTGAEEGGRSYRVGTKFLCQGGHLMHQSYVDYIYCSGESYRTSTHTWAWFQAYAKGQCVRDLHSRLYFKLTNEMPAEWTTAVQECKDARVGELQPFGDASCKGETNASGVREWKDVDDEGCITVVQSDFSHPIYKQRFRCDESGDEKKIVLEKFAGNSCKSAGVFMTPMSSYSISLSSWHEFQSGECVEGFDGAGDFVQLVGLTGNDHAKVFVGTLACDPSWIQPTKTGINEVGSLLQNSLSGSDSDSSEDPEIPQDGKAIAVDSTPGTALSVSIALAASLSMCRGR